MRFWIGIPIALLASASVASAHPVDATRDLANGMLHPLTGLDHLLAMLAVSVWAGSDPRKISLASPVAFMVFLFGGLLAGSLGLHLSMIELLISVSLIGTGFFLMGTTKLPTPLACAAAAAFAFCHGLAHGNEIPPGSSIGQFAVGMMTATVFILAGGFVLAVMIRRLRYDALFRIGGAAVTACGLLLAAGVL